MNERAFVYVPLPPGSLAPADRDAGATIALEYRRCGNPSCWCATDPRGHGPYRYSKRRVGAKVVSVYRGRAGGAVDPDLILAAWDAEW